MKKITTIISLVALAVCVNAQTLQVQSAIESLKRGYLSKAKDAIDLASQHEQTKADAKTWCYKGLIYSQIGIELQKSPNSKYSKMYANLQPAWYETAYEAAERCKELDVKGEFTDNNNSVFRYVSQEYYTQSAAQYNAQNFDEALRMAEIAIKICNMTDDKGLKNDSYYLAGLAAQAKHDNEAILKYYKPLVRTPHKDTNFHKKMPRIFNTMFSIYMGKKDTVEVMKLANLYTKNYPNDYNAYLMMSQAEAWRGNFQKAKEMITMATNKAGNNTELRSDLMCQAAGILELAKDYKGAEENYLAALQQKPQQFKANYGLGIMIYNRGVDKRNEANKEDVNTDEGFEKSQKLTQEANGYFENSIQYFKNALNYLESLTNENEIALNRKNLYDCLKSLSTVYSTLEKYDDLKPIKEKLKQFEG